MRPNHPHVLAFLRNALPLFSAHGSSALRLAPLALGLQETPGGVRAAAGRLWGARARRASRRAHGGPCTDYRRGPRHFSRRGRASASPNQGPGARGSSDSEQTSREGGNKDKVGGRRRGVREAGGGSRRAGRRRSRRSWRRKEEGEQSPGRPARAAQGWRDGAVAAGRTEVPATCAGKHGPPRRERSGEPGRPPQCGDQGSGTRSSDRPAPREPAGPVPKGGQAGTRGSMPPALAPRAPSSAVPDF